MASNKKPTTKSPAQPRKT